MDHRPLKRPTKDEDEDDLLKQMEAFEKANQKPAVQVVKKANAEEPKRKVSKFAESRPKKADASTSKMMSLHVVEKDFVSLGLPDLNPAQPSRTDPFPEVFKWDKRIDSKVEGQRKISIFAQQIKAQEVNQVRATYSGKEVIKAGRDWGSGSKILSGSVILSQKDLEEIHAGNVNILDSKSNEELKKDQEEMMATLDPNIVQFLRSRGQRKVVGSPDIHVAIKEEGAESHHDVEMKTEDAVDLKDSAKRPLLNCKVEKAKMEWMMDLDDDGTQEDVPKSFSARFNLKGDLMAFKDDSTPVNAGLHHHGEEPERPGYTLDELLTLGRSTFPQQRVLAFDTVASIIKNYKSGRFDGSFSGNLFDQLLKADLVTLLRLGLDDSHSAGVLDASASCLKSVLVDEVEEAALDSLFFFGCHIPQPSLATAISKDPDFRQENKELKDIEIMNADLVLGLIRTNLLDRLAYVLDVQRPTSTVTVINMISIISRMARHSLDVAFKIAHHNSLLKVIFRHFLPRSVSSTSSSIIYGSPLHHAVKLIRILMAWGRGLATQILQDHEFGPNVLAYLSVDPEQGVVPAYESLKLTIEAGRCWIVALGYGFMKEEFINFLPVITRHLLYCQQKLSMKEEDQARKFDFHFGATVLEISRMAICAIPSSSLDRFSTVDRDSVTFGSGSSLDWSHFGGILEMTEFMLKKWTIEVQVDCQPFCLQLLAVLFRFFATFITRRSTAEDLDVMVFNSKVAEILDQVTKIFNVDTYFNQASNMTIFRDAKKDGRLRNPTNLPSLGAIKFQGDLVGCLKEKSPFGLLKGYFDLILTSVEVNKEVLRSLSAVLEGQGLLSYLRLFANNQRTRSNWFSAPELTLVINLLLLNEYSSNLNGKLAWKLAMNVVNHLQIGQESDLQLIFERILFNFKYLDVIEISLDEFAHLDLKETLLRPSKAEDLKVDHGTLLKMCHAYKTIILTSDKTRVRSEALKANMSYSLASQTLDSNGETILPSDWQYLPLLTLMSNKKDNDTSQTNSDELERVFQCLLWVYITAVVQEKEPLTNFHASLRISRLSTVFLAGPDLFLDPKIHKLTKMCLLDTLSRAKASAVKFEEAEIPGIDNFRDFYVELVEQFEAVSYGDKLFSMMVILPLNKRNPWKYRCVLWQDHPECLKYVRLSPDDLPKSLSFEDFVSSGNVDEVNVYLRAILHDQIQPERNPLLFAIATESVKKSMKLNRVSTDSETKAHLQVLADKNKGLYNHIRS